MHLKHTTAFGVKKMIDIDLFEQTLKELNANVILPTGYVYFKDTNQQSITNLDLAKVLEALPKLIDDYKSLLDYNEELSRAKSDLEDKITEQEERLEELESSEERLSNAINKIAKVVNSVEY